AAKDADTSGYTPLQKKAAEVIGAAQRITQFLDRDTNPNFAAPNGMQAFLLQFLQDPNQDIGALQDKIQKFWDTLRPLAAGRPPTAAQMPQPLPDVPPDRFSAPAAAPAAAPPL